MADSDIDIFSITPLFSGPDVFSNILKMISSRDYFRQPPPPAFAVLLRLSPALPAAAADSRHAASRHDISSLRPLRFATPFAADSRMRWLAISRVGWLPLQPPAPLRLRHDTP
jgi:hypothetical protein